MKLETLRSYLPILATTVVLVAINIFAVVWYLLPAGPSQLKEGIVPGKVVNITDSTLVTIDPRGIQKEFVISSSTVFIAGRTLVAPASLRAGSIVLVELDLSTTTYMVAKEVRVMTDKRKEKKLP